MARVMKMDEYILPKIINLRDGGLLGKKCKLFEIEDKTYYVFKNGEVYSYFKLHGWINNKLVKLKGSTNSKNGYNSIMFKIDNKKYAYYRHRLIANIFIKNSNNQPCVNHKDGNKLNNSVSNLEWCDWSFNHKHAYAELGRKHVNLGKDCGGTGVFYRKDRNTYSAYIDRFNIRIYLGNYKTEEEACQIHTEAKWLIDQNITTMEKLKQYLLSKTGN